MRKGNTSCGDISGVAAALLQTRKENTMAKKKKVPTPLELGLKHAVLKTAKKKVAKKVRKAGGPAVPCAAVVASPFQARREFDKEELAGLAATMRAHGMLSPIVVRRVGSKFELIAGERRLRAAKLLGWEEIPATVRDVDDRQAAELCAIENLQRTDLNPIERATAIKTTLDGDPDCTQEEVGKRIGLSQGGVANLLRLLELPQPWRQRLMSGEISQAEARSILPWIACPAVLKELDETWQNSRRDGRRGENSWRDGDFQDWLEHSIDEGTEPMSGQTWIAALAKYCDNFKATDAQRAELGIVKVDGKERATNVKLWEKLQNIHEAELIKKAKGGKGKSNSKTAAKAGGKKKPPTAAEKKAQAAEEKRKKSERTKQLTRRLGELRTNWLRYLITGEIGLFDSASEPRCQKLMLYMQTREQSFYGATSKAAMLRKVLRSNSADVWPAVAKLGASRLDDVSIDWLIRCFWISDAEGPCAMVPDGAVADVAEWLKIDLADCWAEEQAGPLSEAFWNAFDKTRLQAMAKGAGETPAKTKTALVEQMLAATIELPVELAPKAKRKKK